MRRSNQLSYEAANVENWLSLKVGRGRGTWDVGRGTWDVGRGTWDVGRGTWDVGRGTWDVGRGTWDVGRGTWDVGRGTRDMGTWDLGTRGRGEVGTWGREDAGTWMVMFTSGKALSKNCLFLPFSFLESECADTARIVLDLESGNRRNVNVHITGLDFDRK